MNTTGRNAEYERDHVRDYRKHDAPVLAASTVWQPHHGEEIIAAYEKMAAMEIRDVALTCAAWSALHLIDSHDCYDANQLEQVADSLRRALRVLS
jgi:hypothetical protein